MVTQKYAIKSLLTAQLSSRNHSTISISVYCKIVKIQLDDIVGVYHPAAHQRLPWRSSMHRDINLEILWPNATYGYVFMYSFATRSVLKVVKQQSRVVKIIITL